MTGTPVNQPHYRVLLLSDDSPLSLGVEDHLRDRVELDIIRDLDPDKVLDRIRAFQPHVVVLGIVVEKGAPALEWLPILSNLPGVRLITMSLQDNSLRVYDRGQVQTVPDATGLLGACRPSEVRS